MLKITKVKKEVLNNPLPYLLLSVILVVGFIVRVYRVDKILGFYFDQGRDALVVWDFIYNGKVFLIGPTTGIAGIFRGPFYYYLIAPFYFLGGGNPVYPAVFLAFTTSVASLLAYYLGFKIHSRIAGLIAAFISAFSFNIVFASRWLSNPTPMLLLSMLLVWIMILITEGKRWAWPILSFVAGLSLFHFGSSGEFFYFPAIAIFAIWQYKNFPTKRQIFLSVIAFLATFLPLLIFDLRHEGILRNNISKFIFGEKTFKGITKYIFEERIKFYYDVFTNKIFHGRGVREIRLLLIVAAGFVFFLPRFLKKKGIVILLILLLSPIIGLFFFQGNYGNVYDYYMTGYYLIFILLFSVVLAEFWKYLLGKAFVLFILYAFFVSNWDVVRARITAGTDGPETIAFENQKKAIDWIYEDSKGEAFNVDVYVPPVIPYAYDYLFRWYGGKVKGIPPSNDQVPLLYTLSEVDPPHPDRIGAWMERQKGIGVVEKEERFGGILVERRKRL